MATELELKIDSNKYEKRIAMLQAHIDTISTLMGEYETLKNNVGDFMGDDDNVEAAKKAAQVGIDRCKKAIEATNANISTIRNTMTNMAEISSNVKTILETAVQAASKNLFN